MRKLARIEIVDNVIKHPNADSLDICTILGWNVITRLGEYEPGDKVIYCEIDSWIPDDIAPFLTKEGHEPKVFKNIKGQRLRTIKLRGEYSQGLLLPISLLDGKIDSLEVGRDVSEILNIVKWEMEVPAQLRGLIKGNFPSFIRKTDQERVQNIYNDLKIKHLNDTFNVTEKLHGSSMTVYYNEGTWGVCSRNLDLKLEDEENTYIKTFISIKNKFESLKELLGFNFAVQGELCGPGINGNNYKLNDFKFFVFDIFNIDEQKYLSPEEEIEVTKSVNLSHVPVLKMDKKINWVTTYGISMIGSLGGMLTYADGESMIADNVRREGLVFKSNESERFTFKVISNAWLLKYE